jgi:uncharacterized protein
MANPFVHLELNTPDLPKAKAFYEQLFGWSFADNPTPYGIYSTFKPESGPGGGATTMTDAPEGWLAYVGVDDIQAATKKAAELGAKVQINSIEIPNVGWFSVFLDPTGQRLALFQPKNS